ncbi:hypothetical protein BH24CHL2_BH24CHL2_4320 [soil metagenome]|jgi:cobalamin biosynthesis protein CobD/CbiB
MNLPATLEAVLILTIVFVPGVIFGQLIQRAVAHFPDKADARHFLAILASGLFLHIVIFPFSTRYILDWYLSGALDDHWLLTYLWAVIAIFLYVDQRR